MGKKKNKFETSKPFRFGAVCLGFLIIGYELAVFVHRASVERVEVLRDHPDTVYVIEPAVERSTGFQEARVKGEVMVRRESKHSPTVKSIREKTRAVESFRFNPNTATIEDLMRLGFSEKQAQSIDNYRSKGGRFRRKADFAKSFVVSDSVFKRLEPFIDIPLVDINLADSAAFDALPGIGGYFAAKMVSYRKALGGYSCKEQLMEIYHFDQAKFDALADLITCSPPKDSLRLWSLPLDSLRRHPYVRNYSTARSIVFFREHNPRECWTVRALSDAGVIDEDTAQKLSRCAISYQ